MARPLRVQYSGAYYHVINRGNAGENIFRNDRDKEKFLEYLATAVERYSLVVHSYCLMSNHFHLLLQTREANLSKAVQWLNVSYAIYFNKKHQRLGHLFQGRFKAVLIEADEYLAQLSRYIHLNPVQAGLVAGPREFLWSSYRVFIDQSKKPEWLTTDEILGHFGKSKNTAISNYRNFVEDFDLAALENLHQKTCAKCVIGDAPFIKWVQDTFLAPQDNTDEIPELKKLKPRVSLAGIFERICAEYKCGREKIVSRGGYRNRERAMAIYLARELSGLTGKELGSFFGVSGAAIIMRYKQFCREMAENKKLRQQVQKIKKELLIA